MAAIGLFYGSDTGNTENVAKKIQAKFGEELVDIYDIAKSGKNDMEQYDYLIIGTPTWYTGELQSDWESFMPTLKSMDLSGKKIALFGLGDQEDYSEYYLDGMGIMKETLLDMGVSLCGLWPKDGYTFESTKCLMDSDHFAGLALDEDRQPELTDSRVDAWCDQVLLEFFPA